MKDSKIQWTHHTFNPIWGCARVSPGCVHCYAETFAKRTGHKVWGANGPRRTFGEKHWLAPLKWNAAALAAGERHRVFCASMADVFEDHVVWETERPKLFELIAKTPALDWLLLTKRPEYIARMLPPAPVGFRVRSFGGDLVWPNVWLGTTVEDQQRANERIPALIAVPAVVRFLSCEPLLEALDLSAWLDEDRTGFVGYIDWVIIGGESGAGARPFHTEWARDLVHQCRDGGRAEAAPFMKQLGANRVAAGRDQLALLAMKSRKGDDITEFPEDLRVREFPEARR